MSLHEQFNLVSWQKLTVLWQSMERSQLLLPGDVILVFVRGICGLSRDLSYHGKSTGIVAKKTASPTTEVYRQQLLLLQLLIYATDARAS